MKLAFYKADCSGATKLDKFIAWGTQGEYSHVEGVFGDGMWFSLSPREAGPRFKKIEPKDDHWDFVEIPLSLGAEARIRKQCEEMGSMEYAWIQAFFSATPFCIGFKDRMFCSKLWAELLKSEGILLDKPCSYSPNYLHEELDMYIRNYGNFKLN